MRVVNEFRHAVLMDRLNCRKRHGIDKFGFFSTLSLTAAIFSAGRPLRTRAAVGLLCTEPVDSNLFTKFLIAVSER